jgi:uncharacterized membrane protein YeaQ/YmgE (transglycosylase-associated protein family)
MKGAEILLNLFIGICGSLIAAWIYGFLRKVRWKRLGKEFLRKTRQITNDVVVTLVIAIYPYREL